MDPKLKSEHYSNLGGINTKISQYLNGPQEMLDLVNFDFSKPGSLTKTEGSTQYIGATVAGPITGLYEFNKLNGFSQIIVTANTNAYYLNAGAFTAIKTGLSNNALFDFVTFVDRLFLANGSQIFKYDGTAASNYSLPPGATLGFSTSVGSSSATGFTGIFVYYYGFLNDRGYLGPGGGGVTTLVAGATQVVLEGFTAPIDYGVTAVAVYRTSANLLTPFRIGYAVAGASQFIDTNLSQTSEEMPSYLWFTLAPKYMEIYNNQLYMAGFSGALSTVYFSDVGEPEGVEPQSFFEVRTDDGDKVTGLKSYNGNLFIFKENSFHVLSGTDPANLTLNEVSNQYGAMSNRAILTYEDRMWFLDKKGVMEFNGANITNKSLKIEPLFVGMNLDSSRDNALAIHNKLRNELWFSIPSAGATFNNITAVYDYTVDAWTKFAGFNPSALTIARSTLPAPKAFYGSYSGAIFNFGTSLFGHNGQAMTCLIQTPYLAELGQSFTNQFRRLYVNCDPITGATSALTINLRQDYGASTVVSRTMYQAPFQSRIDFGVPAKSLSVEISNNTATDSVRIHGYTVEYREQRKT